MLKSISFLFALSLISSSVAFGQTKTSASTKKKNTEVGFYGKRFVMQFGAGIHHNSLLKLVSYPERQLRTDNYYRNYKSEIGSDQFNYSVYGNLGIVLKDRATLSLDFNYYFGDIFLKNIGAKSFYDEFGNFTSTPGYDARVKYNTLRIMPRIEIASRGSNAPVGLMHVLGIGVELSTLKSGNYKSIPAMENNYGLYDSLGVSSRNLRMTDETTFNLTLMYGLEYRLAISKNLAWNFGGYLHINFPIQLIIDEDPFGINDSYNGFYYGYTDYEAEQKLQLSKYRFQNLFSLRTGLVLML
ncbi:hypothetical protein D3C87_29510 [compost metagenome]